RPPLLPGGGPPPVRSLRRPGRMGAQGDPQRGQLGEVLERPHNRRVREGHLARRTLPGAMRERQMVQQATRPQPISPVAGQPAPRSMLVDLARLEREYYERKPNLSDPTQLVSFGTSDHRGSSLRGSFTDAHIAAITQAICDYRRAHGIDGPLHMGKDT